MRSLSIIASFLFFINYLTAQIQDLENIAEGDIVYSSILSNSNGDLYGYIYFFDQGKIDTENTQFEYVLLDKNLNKAANGTYTEKHYDGIKNLFFDCTYMGDGILVSKFLKRKTETLLTYNRIISLKDKSVSKEFMYENDSFKELSIKNVDELKENYKGAESFSLAYAINYQNLNGFFVTENNKKGKNYLEKDLKVYGADQNLKWTYSYNVDGVKKDWKSFNVININEGLIIGGLSYFSNSKYIDKFNLVGIDVTNGTQIFEYPFEDKNSAYSHTVNLRYFGDKIYIVGNYSPYSKEDFNWQKNLGVYTITLDKTGKEISKKYYPWSEIASNLEANKYGVVEKGYYLSPMKIYILKDGSFSYLAEKFKGVNSNYTSTKSLDFVLFNFDKDGKFKANYTIQKDKSKWFKNDYLFHQYIKDDQGVVFFFRDHKKDDETRDKNWILGINTIINGEFKEETIPMSSEDFFIRPIPAKEGYIMLQEFNEKSNLNQIRLEKLNY
ncbi:DUF6770 family protein [Moheibacter sediminis]|uniref:Uncharacterized protein n=1 Tax=Moheibacter sediminis TaxID=1434700 RepID=A0A1W2C3B8_9FLAO|nr:DUF6770 family protein [Moheibacter sediminis]SMC79591.1 hypothetical protein SAMN06296427_108100 [Moheibacter sediminis]